MVGELMRDMKEVEREEMVKQSWYMAKIFIYYYASSVVIGIILEVGDVVTENLTWLRKKG